MIALNITISEQASRKYVQNDTWTIEDRQLAMTISEKLHSANEGSAFLVGYKDHAAVAAEETYCSFDDPDKGQDGEDEGGPVDEGSLLVVKNGPKRPSNGDRRRKVAFRRSEGVSSSGTFKEEAEKYQCELVFVIWAMEHSTGQGKQRHWSRHPVYGRGHLHQRRRTR